jgi:hypothetical protein
MSFILPERWSPLRYHPEQHRLIHSPARFKVVPAGRRSGKTEHAKRHVVLEALQATGPSPAYFCAAPVRDQAKRIYWDDLKLLTMGLTVGRPKESELTLELLNGARITVIGMDRPERIEGTPWNGGVLDEYANMKEEAWQANVRPALADRQGWCWLIGVPEGRNHYYETYKNARGPWNVLNGGEWDAFTWHSKDILPPAEVEAARQTMDPMTFKQEYEADFISFQGQCYYPFHEDKHTVRHLATRYNDSADLIFCFDFNVDPGVAIICQEMEFPRIADPVQGLKVDNVTMFANSVIDKAQAGTAAIGEVYIPRNSNTRAVCRKLIQDWGSHRGRILIYGDATGGGRSTQSEHPGQNDWDIVKNELYAHFGDKRVLDRVPSSNPTERSRVNAVNTRLETGDRKVHLKIDPATCPHLVKDFEGVSLVEGGSGEIDKKADPKLTHLTDAIGYYIVAEFPVRKEVSFIRELRA